MSLPSANRYASGLSQHPIASHVVGETAGQVLDQLDGAPPDLVVCFASPHFVGAFDDMTSGLRDLLGPRTLMGATMVSVIGGASEIEDAPAFSVFAASVPGASFTAVDLQTIETGDGAAVIGWPEGAGVPVSTLLLLADPFSFAVDAFLRHVNDEHLGVQVIGGLASAANVPGGNRLVLDDHVASSDAVGVLVDVPIRTVVSQGCRPIGQPFVITSAWRNVVAELGSRPALERLHELAEHADDAERQLLRQGLHVGVVVDEHKVEFGRGDFLVRGVVGADAETGSIMLGELVEVGQTIQFHVRDRAAADEDLRLLLTGLNAEAALLFTCNGRGRHLFGVPDHDAALVAELLGSIPAAGAFCGGEVGPVGGRNFLHGFTASLALFQ